MPEPTAAEEREKIVEWLEKRARSYEVEKHKATNFETYAALENKQDELSEDAREIRDGAHLEGPEKGGG